MKCQNCGDSIPPFAEEKVEDNIIDQIVSHTHSTENPAKTTKDYYCDPKCFVESYEEEVETE